MEQSIKAYLPLNFNQILTLIRQLSLEEKQRLLSYLQEESTNEPTLTHFASEKALAEDWLSPEEDAAWANL
jgi:hypothetical protein